MFMRCCTLLLLGWWLLMGCGGDAETAAPANESDVLLQETFAPGTLGEWVIEGDATGQTAVLDEQLVVRVEEPNVMQFATLATPTFTDFLLEVDARLLQGDTQSSFGVLFRMQDPGQFYRFEITGNGMYIVERRNGDGSWTRFINDWTATPAINQGLNATNRLKVEAIGRNITLFVNDIMVHQMSDNAYAGGSIALDAGTFVQPGTQVAFDNLIVRTPQTDGRPIDN